MSRGKRQKRSAPTAERKPSNHEGFQLERKCADAMRQLLERRTKATYLPADYFRRASAKEDMERGTDFFLFGMPVDVTGAPLSMKSHTKQLGTGMELDGNLMVDFGLRRGNNGADFKQPVLVMSIRNQVNDGEGRDTERSMVSPEIGKTIVTNYFDDVAFTGRFRYSEATDGNKGKTHVILPSGTGKAPSRNNGDLIRIVQSKTDERWSNIVVYPYVNPQMELVSGLIATGSRVFVGAMGRSAAVAGLQWIDPDRVAKAARNPKPNVRIASIVR